MLSLNNVALRRGTEILFENTSLTIHQGNKVGLIGANGSGKTSLFKLILAELEADRGSIDLPQGTTIAHMAQEVFGSNQPAIDYVLAGDDVYTSTINAIKEAEANGKYDNIAQLHEKLDSIDGYTARARGEQLMAGLGFSTAEIEKPLSDFSGGWRIRLNLAQTLLRPSDLLLLDEPTNHLDLDAIIWLSDWIKQFPGTLVLISHDREFLDECVDHIAFLHNQSIELFKGNYSRFESLRAARLAEHKSQFDKQQKQVAHMQDFVRRFRAQATKAKQAQSRIKALERMELIAPAHVDSPFEFKILAQEKTSIPLLTLEDAVLGYDTGLSSAPILTNVSLSFLPGDRFGLLGVNGAGKSTLIKSLNGELPLLGGSRTPGANVKTGYFSQHQLDELDLSASAFEHFVELGRSLGSIPGEQVTRNFLGGFNFHGEKVLDRVRTFSGGEKARLALALITYTKPNLLLMDEPTNHLDIDMRQALTIALQSFSGALLLVSHDRHLMSNTVDQFILIDQGQAGHYAGDLADYRNQISPSSRRSGGASAGFNKGASAGSNKGASAGFNKGASAASDTKAPTNVTGSEIDIRPVAKQIQPHKAARQLKTRINTLENRLTRLQRKLSDVVSSLSNPALYQTSNGPDSNQENLQGLLREQMELNAEIEVVESEWLELATELESNV